MVSGSLTLRGILCRVIDIFGEHGPGPLSSLIDWKHTTLLVGILVLVIAVVQTVTGKTWERWRGWVSRSEKPKRFWSDVAALFLLGLFFILWYGISN